MFGFLRKLFAPETAPEGPVTFDFEIGIDAPPANVYPLLDFADDRYAKKQLGHSVTQTCADPETYSLVLSSMPDVDHQCVVKEKEPGRLYAFRCVADPKVGRLQWAEERYSLEPDGEGGTLLTLMMEAQFDEPMPTKEYSHHVALMAMGCNIAVEKLKLHAEQGTAAVRQMEAEQFG